MRSLQALEWASMLNGVVRFSRRVSPSRVRAVVAVWDTDAMPERAAFRSKQNGASDCNQAGQLADRLFAARGGVRIAPRLEMDVSRDAARAQTEEWVDRTLLPALSREAGA